MAGYFKVSMEAAIRISEASEGPELLAGYVTVCGYSFGEKRTKTAAGAKAIRLTTGCTDFRSKRIMNELRTLRFADKGLLSLTSNKVGNAAISKVEQWDGVHAYIPSLLLERHPEHGAALAKLFQDEVSNRATLRDALLLLLHVYSCVDYAEWFGCPPDAMAYQSWRKEGFGGNDFELGYQGDVANLPLWLVGEPTDGTWTAPKAAMALLFGDDEQSASNRFWAALWCLKRLSLVIPVVSVQTGGRAYPLWVYNVAYRDSLRELGVVPDLGTETQRAANDSGLDPDNYLIRYAIDEMDRSGTGLFYCVGSNPVVRTVVLPRLHAPTPVNLDGIEEAAVVTRNLWREVRAARRQERTA